MVFPKRKINKHKSYVFDCFVDSQLLIKVVELFSECEFFIGINKLERRSNFLVFLEGLDCRLEVTSYGDDFVDVIFASNKDFFIRLSDELIECIAEVVVFCFPVASITFEKFLNENLVCFNPQKKTIQSGLCDITCTWVTNEDRLHFIYNTLKYNSDTIRTNLLSAEF